MDNSLFYITNNKKRYLTCCCFVVILAIILRFAFLGYLPGRGALFQDEAYAGYEAWSLMNYGTDDAGYSNPVYFVAWGSGMNALESYCMMPFIALFGLNPLSIRFPAAILGVITVLAFGFFIKEGTKEKDLAFIGLLFMAVCPWNVMISRWGLESNFLPGFVLLGSVFLLKSLDNSIFFPISMFFYGMSLYAYSVAWLIMPFIILLSVLFLWRKTKFKIVVWHYVGVFVLFILALPLLLFVVINAGMINEISTSLFSIPRMSVFRSSEVDIRNILRNANRLFKVLILQKDKYSWNAIPPVGIYYYVSLPFFILGLITEWHRFRKKESNCADALLSIQFIFGLTLGLLVEGNVNKVNILHIPVIYFICVGIQELLIKLKKKDSRLRIWGYSAIIVLYFASFIVFLYAYSVNYNEKFAEKFMEGLDEALDTALIQRPNDIIHITDVLYPNVLAALEYPTDELIANANWKEESVAFKEPNSIQNIWFYDFADDEIDEAEGVYICKYSNTNAVNYMKECDMAIYEYGYCILGIK